MKAKTSRKAKSRIFVSILLALTCVGIGISCSKDASVSSTPPDAKPRATKLAFSEQDSAIFQPQTDVNYDPFQDMSLEERIEAIGGPESSKKYFEVVARHLVQAMSDKEVLTTFYNVVPKAGEGEISLAEIAITYPHVLKALATSFKDDIASKDIQSTLSSIIQDTDSNDEAVLKVATALLDLVVTLALSPGDSWDSETVLPVFYVPANDDEGSTVEGVDANQKVVSFSIDGDKIPYSFLFLNYDEDSPMARDEGIASIQVEPKSGLDGLWAYWQNTLRSLSLTTPAYAHSHELEHGSHVNIVEPIKSIIIYNDHEPWYMGNPEIWLYFTVLLRPNTDDYNEDRFDLVSVDEEDENHRQYRYKQSSHGPGSQWNNNIIHEVKVMEHDPGYTHDEVATWEDIPFWLAGSYKTLWPSDSVGNEDARVVMRMLYRP